MSSYDDVDREATADWLADRRSYGAATGYDWFLDAVEEYAISPCFDNDPDQVPAYVYELAEDADTNPI